jgi:ATP-dependent Clp protease ATP-binding subunit ClpA
MNPKRALDDMRTIKQLLTEAERISRELGEAEPGAEHMLLSAIALPDGTAGHALGRLGVDADRIRAALVDEQADALVAVGVPREQAETLAVPTPLGDADRPLLYGAGPTAREVFKAASDLARGAKQRLVGAHVVLAIAGVERGTVARLLDRLGLDRGAVADAARAELPGA